MGGTYRRIQVERGGEIGGEMGERVERGREAEMRRKGVGGEEAELARDRYAE